MKFSYLLILFACAGIAAAKDDSPAPLFSSFEPLELEITAPFSQLRKGREAEELEEFSATLRHTTQVDIKLRARGKFRRSKDTCNFPPLRLNFAKKTSKGTIFEKQDKIKLVTQCQPGSQFAQLVVKEYLAYRIFNLLSDESFKVRLVNAKLVNSDSRNKAIQHQAFLIEAKKKLAKRLNTVEHHAQEIKPGEVLPGFTAIVNLFEFMIGNTDWSMFISAPGKECCHNLVPLRDSAGSVLPIPYDFDFSGTVNAPYAEPPLGLKIRRVTQRLYRGRCLHNSELDAAVRLFQNKRQAIYALYQDSAELNKRSKKKALAYYDKFYAILDDPELFHKNITNRCLGHRSS